MKDFFKRIVHFFSSNLIWAVVIMIVLGIIVGQFAPLGFVRIFTTFNAIFSSFLSFIVPLLILALVTAAIADTQAGAGKMLVSTIVLAYASTVLAGVFTYGVSDFAFPRLITFRIDGANVMDGILPASQLEPYFKFTFPPFMDTMSALLLSFLLGLTIIKYEMPILKGAVKELKLVVMSAIEKVILPLLPIYIFGVFLKMTVAGEMEMITHVYLKVIGIMILLMIVVLLLQYCIAGLVSHKNPFRMLTTMFPALMTALASSSSAATLPITLRCADKMGAQKNVVDFVIPMCANIHLSGAAVRTVALAIATMITYQIPYSTPQIIGFIFLFSIAVLAAPGIPGGVIMAAVGMIEAMLGFTPEMIAIIVTLSIALDSIGTAVNVCGDGALMMIVNTIMNGKSDKK
ncbi:MAG: dicarboxylate/amino acid:cation symporter [Paludibacteraceae bacterium]|nr:dicarboxylate/amino acid:cation symporter [Paludibacteraceae bacterium]